MKHDPRKIEKRYEFYRCESCKKQIAETIYDDRGAKAHVEFERCFFADNNPYCASCMSIRPLTLSERTEKRRREQAERQREMDAETRRIIGPQPVAEEGETVVDKTPTTAVRPVADAGSPDRSDGGCPKADTRQNEIGAYIIPMDAIHPKGEAVAHDSFVCRGCDRELPLAQMTKDGRCRCCVYDESDVGARPVREASHAANRAQEARTGTKPAVHPKSEPVALDCDGNDLRVGDWVVYRGYEVEVACKVERIELDRFFVSLAIRPSDQERRYPSTEYFRLTSDDGYYVATGKVVRGAFKGAPEWAKSKSHCHHGYAWFLEASRPLSEPDVLYCTKDEHRKDTNCRQTARYHDGDWRSSLIARCV